MLVFIFVRSWIFCWLFWMAVCHTNYYFTWCESVRFSLVGRWWCLVGKVCWRCLCLIDAPAMVIYLIDFGSRFTDTFTPGRTRGWVWRVWWVMLWVSTGKLLLRLGFLHWHSLKCPLSVIDVLSTFRWWVPGFGWVTAEAWIGEPVWRCHSHQSWTDMLYDQSQR